MPLTPTMNAVLRAWEPMVREAKGLGVDQGRLRLLVNPKDYNTWLHGMGGAMRLAMSRPYRFGGIEAIPFTGVEEGTSALMVLPPE